MTKILNLTPYYATPEQIDAGVIELSTEQKETLEDIVNFQEIPSYEEIQHRAEAIATLVHDTGASAAMVSGVPFPMGALETALKQKNIKPMYAFTQRINVEKTNEDGTVVETTVFKHVGFVEV